MADQKISIDESTNLNASFCLVFLEHAFLKWVTFLYDSVT